MVWSIALSSDCTKVYPSEYAYHDGSVTRTERSTANCRRFPSGLQAGVFTERYIRCDGTRLRLLDSDLGSDQYVATSYYEWLAETVPRQLLFTFPARVNLTTITLHYYSDSQQGLPTLRFTAVSDNIDNTLAKYNQVDVAAQPPASGNKEGSRSVSDGLKWNTRKILMIKAGAGFIFSISKVQFFVCNGEYWYHQTIILVYIEVLLCISCMSHGKITFSMSEPKQLAGYHSDNLRCASYYYPDLFP